MLEVLKKSIPREIRKISLLSMKVINSRRNG